MSKIKSQLLFSMVIVGLIPVILASIAHVTLTRNSISASKRDTLASFSTQVLTNLRSIMRNTEGTLKVIHDSPVLVSEDYSTDQKKMEFARMRSYFPEFSSLALLDRNGFVLESTDRLEVGERDLTSWCEQALAGETFISRPQIDSKPGQPPRLCCLFYLPVPSKETNQTIHVVKAKLNFDRIWDLLDESKIGETCGFVLLDSQQNILYHADRQKIYRKYQPHEPADFGPESAGTYAETKGNELLYHAKSFGEPDKISGAPWTLIAHLDKSQTMKVINQTQFYAMMAAVGSLAAAYYIAQRLSRRIARPVVSIAEAASNVAQSKYQSEIPEEGPEEICSLARQFNKMASEVKLHREELETLVDTRTRRLSESEENLRSLTYQLRASYNAAKEAILIVQPDGKVLASSRRMTEFFEFNSESLTDPRSIYSIIATCARDPGQVLSLWAEVQQDEKLICSREWELAFPVARTLAVYTAPVQDHGGHTIARLWMFDDITSQRELETSLRQSSKMEAIGRLAGGVAHDFNNLLTGIIGSLSLINLDDPDSKFEAQRLITSATKAGSRAAELVKGLLGFSRQSHLKLENCALNNVIQDLHDLLRPTIDPRIRLDLDLQDTLWPLRADSNQIEQVIINMIVNAVDVLPLGGTISLATRNVTIHHDQADLIPEARAGDFLRITVSDNGCGMNEETRAKIFEPFFTTKEQGKGTGLGLATSFGIIQQHCGWITCDSLPGQGSTFHVFLPRGKDVPEPVATAKHLEKPKGGREAILLVDDEVVVRSVAEAVLKKHGYQIMTASDGQEALEVLAQNDGAIDLVLMDMTMPRLSGKDTFCAMRRGIAPTIPVIICSGYLVDLDDFAVETGSKPEGFLQKPYPLQDLARAVRVLLDERQSAALNAS